MRNNLNEAEIFAKNVLQNFYFKQVKLQMGDNFLLKLPDIYTKDHTIGIEVGQAELREDFLLSSDNNKLKTTLKIDNSKPQTNAIKAQTVFFATPNQIKTSELQNQNDEQTFNVNSILMALYLEKLRKAKKGNYSGCVHCHLCIVSYFRPRDVKIVKNFVKQMKKLGAPFFEKVFIILSTSLFVIDQNYRIKIVDYSDEEFNLLLQASKFEYDALLYKAQLKQLKLTKPLKPNKQKPYK